MPTGGFVRRSGYSRKWLILGVALGIIANVSVYESQRLNRETALAERDRHEP